MKKYMILMVVGFLFSITAHAQWKSWKVGLIKHTRLEEEGNVGIGTAVDEVPADKLHVIGNARANEFIAINGIVNSPSGNLSLRTGGAAYLTIVNGGATAGFVGIGTPSPTEMLEVSGTIRSSQFNATNGIYNALGTTNLSLRTNGTDRLSILNSNGFVGIGVPIASEMLHVNGNVLSNQYTASNGIFNSTSDLSLSTNGTSRLSVRSSNGYVAIGLDPTETPIEILHVNGNILSNQYTASNGIFNSNGNLLLSTNGTNRLSLLNSNGNVGIGIGAPEEKLHVGGNVVLDNGGNPTIYTGTGAVELNRFLLVSNSKGSASSSGIKAGGVLISDDYNYANPSKNDLVVKGKVSIGTALANNPNGYTLAVNGKIGAKDMQVETKSTTWPDYVFLTSYQLPSLYEVEKYITENNHLKDVPSAQEIEEKHSLGEMDAILLKKVEELTLYIIEQQKQIDTLKKELKKKK